MGIRTATVVTLAGLLLGGAGSASAADAYDIDLAHTSVTFRVKHFDIAWTYGMFRGMKGKLMVDQKKPANSAVELSVDAASVFTNNKQRDGHLRSPDFLNVKQFPTITFKSTSVRKVGRDYQVKGTLTLHGTTKPVAVRFQRTGAGKGPKGKHRIGFVGTFDVKRSDYGMKKLIGPAGDRIEITVAIEGIRK